MISEIENPSKTDIVIKGYWITSFLIGLGVGLLSVFIINNYGKFSYTADLSHYNPYTGQTSSYDKMYVGLPISVLKYTSPFGSVIENHNTGYKVGEVYKGSMSFQEECRYYIPATIKDYKYILLFSTITSIILIFFKNFKLKIN